MTNNGKYFFCLALLLQPLLRLYGLPGIGGTFGDYTIILVVLYIILKKNSRISRINSVSETIELLPILICVTVNILFTWDFSFGIGNQLICWMRNLLYYFVLVYGVKSFYSIEHGYKAYRIIAYACTLFSMVQTVASSVFNIYIPGQFGSFALTDLAAQRENYDIYSHYNLFRPDSFFTEPAHYATFVSGFMILCSLREVNKKNIFAMIFCSFGVLLSGSTTGIVMVTFIWAGWLFRTLRKKNNIKWVFPTVVLAIVALSIVAKSDSFQLMMSRTFDTQDALNSRFSWMEEFAVLNTPLDWLFGKGNSNDAIKLMGWLPGWPMILVEYGIIGLFLFISSYLLMFFHVNRFGKNILLFFIVLGMGTEVVADMYILVILPFVINSNSVSETKRISTT
ncbi:MAG: hypothetical protein IKC28_03695 [Clostridia bacterium]|nr:hypothetical protein [Clostridia bacterium]